MGSGAVGSASAGESRCTVCGTGGGDKFPRICLRLKIKGYKIERYINEYEMCVYQYKIYNYQDKSSYCNCCILIGMLHLSCPRRCEGCLRLTLCYTFPVRPARCCRRTRTPGAVASCVETPPTGSPGSGASVAAGTWTCRTVRHIVPHKSPEVTYSDCEHDCL